MNPRQFIELHAVAAPLPLSNVDTDKILPAEFLKTVERRGLGSVLFYPLRFTADGAPAPDFILNRQPWVNAGILVSLENFGSGSSREHAPWALKDYGIRAIIASSFADIFRQNCIKNGILPATVTPAEANQLLELIGNPSDCELRIDLRDRTISDGNGSFWTFSIDDTARETLLVGRDEIKDSWDHLEEVDQHFAERKERFPWILPIRW